MRCALSASQCASRPSPSEVAMPMPVIQTSMGSAFGLGSVMRQGLLREADTPCLGIHMNAQIGIRKRNMTERDRRVASRPAVNADFCFGDRETRAFMNHARLDCQQFARRDETAHLCFLDH